MRWIERIPAVNRAGVVPHQCMTGLPSVRVSKLWLGGPVKKKGKHRGIDLKTAGLVLQNGLRESWREAVLIKVFTETDWCTHDGVREVASTEHDQQ